MATVPVRTFRLSRDELAAEFKNPKIIRAFEALFNDVSRILPDAVGDAQDTADQAETTALTLVSDVNDIRSAAVLLLAGSAIFSNERVFTPGTTLTITDNGPGGTYDIDVNADTAASNDTIVQRDGSGRINVTSINSPASFSSQTVGTGAATATLTANKPGANSGVTTWLTINVNGTNYFLPLWS
jgi:hypothetical protein